MKIHPQYINENGLPAFVVLPIEEYETLLYKLEDVDGSERFPLDLVETIASGIHPIKAFREYRKLSQVALAKQAAISRQYLSQIENHERTGTTKVLKAIAQVLNVDLDDIA